MLLYATGNMPYAPDVFPFPCVYDTLSSRTAAEEDFASFDHCYCMPFLRSRASSDQFLGLSSKNAISFSHHSAIGVIFAALLGLGKGSQDDNIKHAPNMETIKRHAAYMPKPSHLTSSNVKFVERI